MQGPDGEPTQPSSKRQKNDQSAVEEASALLLLACRNSASPELNILSPVLAQASGTADSDASLLQSAVLAAPPSETAAIIPPQDPGFGPRWHVIWYNPTTGGQLFVREQPLWTGRTKALADIAYFVKERNDSRHSDKLAVRPFLKEGEWVGLSLNGDGSLKLPTKGCPKSHQRKSKYFFVKRCSHGVVVGNSPDLLPHADRLEAEESDVVEFVFKREEKGGHRVFSLTIGDSVTTFTTETFEVSTGRCPEQTPRDYRALRSSLGGPGGALVAARRPRRKILNASPPPKMSRPRRHARSQSAEAGMSDSEEPCAALERPSSSADGDSCSATALTESRERCWCNKCQSFWLANALVLLGAAPTSVIDVAGESAGRSAVMQVVEQIPPVAAALAAGF